MGEKKAVFRPWSEVFSSVKTCFGNVEGMSGEFRVKLKNEISEKSEMRMYIAFWFILVFRIFEVILRILSSGFESGDPIYLGSTVAIISILALYLLYYFVSRKKSLFSVRLRRIIAYITWILLLAVALADSFAEINSHATLTRMSLLSFGIAIVPIMPLYGVIPIVAVNLTANIIFTVKAGLSFYRIEYMTAISILTLACAVAQYVTHVNVIRERNAMYDKNRRLSELAEKDSLTRVLNRRGLKNMIDRFYDPKMPCAVFMLDIDLFKVYNDMYFHDAGDECLKKIAMAIEKCVFRKDDLVARYGGEEFLVCIFDIDSHSVISVARRIQMEIAKLKIEFKLEGHREYVTVSIGIAHSRQGSDFNYLVSCADMELYHAKNNGRNCISYDGEIYKNTSVSQPAAAQSPELDLSDTHIGDTDGRKTILIVDDHQANLDLLKKIVSKDYAVVTALNGMDALDLLNSDGAEIDGVILDLFMPAMDGFTFLSEIKGIKKFNNLPIMVITGTNDAENEKKALALGAWDYVSKPYDASIIKFRLNNILTRSYLINLLKQRDETEE